MPLSGKGAFVDEFRVDAEGTFVGDFIGSSRGLDGCALPSCQWTLLGSLKTMVDQSCMNLGETEVKR